MTNTIAGTLLKPKAHEKNIKTIAVGDYFGDAALVGEQPVHMANVVVTATDGVTCLTLDRDAYHQLIIGYAPPSEEKRSNDLNDVDA